jgi:hypothetical protein
MRRWRGVAGHGRAPGMAQPPIRNPSAGGFLIAAGVMGGAVIGFLFGQATIGLLIGAVVSIGVSLAIWARERGR